MPETNREAAGIVQLVWPEWEICETIGKGAFATVYRASRKGKIAGEKDSAIKLIRIPQNESDWDDLISEGRTEEEARRYFQRVVEDSLKEIQTMEELNGHTNIVNIFDYKRYSDPEKNAWYILIRMELLQKVNPNILDEKQRVQLGIDVCTALSICQKKNIVHRDVSIDNVFFHDGNYKLGDFGVAKVLQESNSGFHSVAGKPIYMAPELFNASVAEKDIEASKKIDIYSLGVLLYRLCHHMNYPFEDADNSGITTAERQEAFRRRVIEGERIPPPKYATPAFSDVILKACAANPGKRYESADEMLKALQTLQEKDRKNPSPNRKTLRITCIAAAAVLLIAGILFLIRPWQKQKNTYHITLTAPENTYVQNFSATKEAVRNRLNLFVKDRDYEWNVNDERIDLILPAEAFAGQPVEKVMSMYLVRPAVLYAVDLADSTSEFIEIGREDLESVTQKEGAIEGIDPKMFGLDTPTYPYIEITLSDSFISRYGQQIDQWDRFAFAQDINQYRSSWFYFRTAASGDRKTYYIFNTDPGGYALELTYYNITHEPLPDALEFTVDMNPLTKWQETAETARKGENQRNAREITGESVSFSIAADSSLTEGNKLDLEIALKAHLDAIGNPYAIGTLEDLETGMKYVIMTSPDRMGMQIMNAICTTSGTMKIRTGFTEADFPFAGFRMESEPEEASFTLCPDVSIIDSDLLRKLAEKALENDGYLYISLGGLREMPFFAAKAEMLKQTGDIHITHFCEILDNHPTAKPLEREDIWMKHLMKSLMEAPVIPIRLTSDQYQINLTAGGKISAGSEFGVRFTLGASAMETRIREICPTATVSARGESIDINLNLYPDETLPVRSTEMVQRIYEMLDFPSMYANDLSISLIHEAGRGQARICFSKKAANIQTLGTNEEEGYVYIHGEFTDERILPYTESIIDRMNHTDFFQGMTHAETYWEQEE